MNLMYAILLNSLFFLIGYMISVSIGMRRRWEIFGVSYLLGSGFITIIFLILEQHFNFRLDVINLLFSTIILVASSIFFLLLSRNKVNLNHFNIVELFKKLLNLKQPKKAIVFTVLGLITFTLWENYFWPVTAWDSLALYDFRARIIYQTGSMVDGIKLGYFFQYPPYTSFLHAFSYMLSIQQVKVAYSFIYLSLIVSVYALVRRNKSQLVSLLAMLFIASDTFIFRHATMAYTNLAYISYLSIGLLYLGFWIENGRRSDLVTGFLLSGFSTWVRAADPFWIIAVFLGFVGVIKNKKFHYTFLIFTIYFFSIKSVWEEYVTQLFIANNGIANNLSERMTSVITKLINNYQQTIITFTSVIFETIKYFLVNLFEVARLALPLSFLAFLADIRSSNKSNFIIYITVLGLLILSFAGVVFFSLFFETWKLIPDSLQRLLMIIIPILTFIIFNSKLFDEN